MSEFEFKPWPKIARLNRPVVITEKIDGTNACVWVSDDGTEVRAQSRTREIFTDADNFGFAAWVQQNAGTLADDLGPGYHYGEWWGVGIQRGYGLRERRFSLFNTKRWTEDGEARDFHTDGLMVVPVIYELSQFDSAYVRLAVGGLREYGSMAAPGFMKPEGVVVFHVASQTPFKVLLENDAEPKGTGR